MQLLTLIINVKVRKTLRNREIEAEKEKKLRVLGIEPWYPILEASTLQTTLLV